MNTTHPQQEPSPSRKNYAAVIGFVLALLGFVSYGLTAIPALILSLIGIRPKKHRKLAVVSIVICLSFLFLHVLFVTPMGAVPYPLNLLKYRIVCQSHFWLGFDREHLVEAQSRRTLLLGGSLGSMYFKTEQGDLYDPNQAISYAEKNGWVYEGKIHLTKDDFSKFLSESDQLEEESWDLWRTMHEMTGYIRTPFWIKDNCIVLAFNTGQGQGLPSYIMINDERSEMAVYANHGLYPDGPHPFELPPLFEKAK